MFSDRLNQQDLQDYRVNLGGADVVDDVGFGTIAAQSFQNTFKIGPTAALFDMMRTGFEHMNRIGQEDNSITGLEANSTFGLEGEFAFEPDEKVYPEEGKRRNERAFSARLDTMAEQIAIAKGTNVTFASIVGGLAGGFADPVSLVGGALVGNLARAKTAMFVAKNTEALKEFPTLLKIARAGAVNNTMTANALEGMAGAAALDIPAQAYFMKKHNQDFQTREFIMQMAGAGIFGAALPAALEPILRPAKELMGKAQQAFKNRWLKTYGSDSEKALEEFMSLLEIADQMDAEPAEDILGKIRHLEVWEPRDGDVEFSSTQITNRDEFEHTDFHIGRRSGEKKFREVSGHGAGTVLFVDDPVVAKNSVQDIDGKFDGEVKSIRLKSSTKIVSPEDFVDVKEDILNDLIGALSSTIKTKKTKQGKQLGQLKKELLAAENMNDFHDIVSSSPLVRHPEMYLHSVLKKQGFDGYHVMVHSPDGSRTANGLVMIDAMSATDIDEGKTLAEFMDFVGRDEFTTDDGIVSFFDETKVDVMGRQTISKLDVDSDGAQRIRQSVAREISGEVSRMTSPKAKRTHVEPMISEEQMAPVIADETTDASAAAARASLDALEARASSVVEEGAEVINLGQKRVQKTVFDEVKTIQNEVVSDLEKFAKRFADTGVDDLDTLGSLVLEELLDFIVRRVGMDFDPLSKTKGFGDPELAKALDKKLSDHFEPIMAKEDEGIEIPIEQMLNKKDFDRIFNEAMEETIGEAPKRAALVKEADQEFVAKLDEKLNNSEEAITFLDGCLLGED